MIRIVIAKSEKVQEAFTGAVKKMGSAPGVCVLLTRPFESVKPALKRKGVNFSNIFFIDTVAEAEEDNVVHVQQGNLTALSITISQALQRMGSGKKFLVIDSLTTLSVNNPPKSVARFALFLIERVRQWKADTVIIVGKETLDSELASILKQSADAIEGK